MAVHSRSAEESTGEIHRRCFLPACGGAGRWQMSGYAPAMNEVADWLRTASGDHCLGQLVANPLQSALGVPGQVSLTGRFVRRPPSCISALRTSLSDGLVPGGWRQASHVARLRFRS